MKKIIITLLTSFLFMGCNNMNNLSNTMNSNSQNKESTSSNLSLNNSSSTSINYEKQEWNEDGVLKILSIGNSFSDDSMEYVAKIALSIGVKEVKLGNLYIGGCDLQKHNTNASNDIASYEYRTNTGKGWSTKIGTRISEALDDEEWDYISLQQSSGLSGLPSSYEPYLSNLIEYVQKRNPHAKIAWNMTWAYQQDSSNANFVNYNKDQMTMYEAICNTVQEVIVEHEGMDLVIPCGTAIQNARTSYVEDTLTRDGYHLSLDLGRYVAGLTFVHKLTGLELVNPYSPVSDELTEVAIESAKNAVKTPYSVTISENNIENILENYDLLDIAMEEFAYWNSTLEDQYNELIKDNSNSVKFFATKRFVEEEIPVGSIILIADGWQYRPEAWKDDEKQTVRPTSVKTKFIIINETFWDGYLYRAFNVSKQDSSSLENCKEEAHEALKIYIPKK